MSIHYSHTIVNLALSQWKSSLFYLMTTLTTSKKQAEYPLQQLISFICLQTLYRCANAVGGPHPSAVCPDTVSSTFLPRPSSPGATVTSTSSSQRPTTLAMEQMQLPVTGTRKAKVLYDYDAHDASELSLLADEV